LNIQNQDPQGDAQNKEHSAVSEKKDGQGGGLRTKIVSLN